MYFSKTSLSMPYISLVDYSSNTISDNMLYYGNSSSACYNVIKNNDGADVYVRFKPDYKYDKVEEEKEEIVEKEEEGDAELIF